MCNPSIRLAASPQASMSSRLVRPPPTKMSSATLIASLITRQKGDAWIHTTRRWVLVTWMFQTTGILLGAGWASVGGMTCEGLRISVGNPHLACVVESPLEDFDLSAPPSLDSELFPDGANLELVRLVGERSAQMVVYERGSGVTRSCGTGC